MNDDHGFLHLSLSLSLINAQASRGRKHAGRAFRMGFLFSLYVANPDANPHPWQTAAQTLPHRWPKRYRCAPAFILIKHQISGAGTDSEGAGVRLSDVSGKP
ncbi:hypothetical protein PANA5342_0834 [Pantoea ananatis LMG 5342]|nr:hypothetical protein PANA5342_0834 [Pantoea ananatis LMG 5342]